ncbi:MAG: hypothetical protein BGO38_09935 [Cellulomonas sp. 73-145]|uniref:SCO6880 family protein n=1 Tax=Cellulomonas sp. 73-145 TaxID=1895739 RepID=UPI000927F65C|nr:SCO6880 family protein [Cellulomonas sp. 73-145]OJV61015.1 MAG: hypothetical protein BGO38_09935 [Cellulomonas sp. 73-145]
MSAPQSGSTTVFGRLERRGVLLGLSAAQLVVVGVAAAVAVAAVYSAGSGGLLVSAPLWVVLLVVGTVTVGGRPLVGWLPLMTAWRGRRLLGTTSVARSTRVEHQPRALTLPGVAGRLELVEEPALGGVLVVDRRAGTATALLAVNASGFLLDDGSVQEHKVGAWGRVLAGVCQQSTIVRVQILVRTVPGGLSRARQWWREHRGATGSRIAEAVSAMLDDGFVSAHRRETLLVVAARLPRGYRGGHLERLQAVVAQLDAVASSLRAADLNPSGWLDTARLAEVLTSAYDPAAAARREGLPARPMPPADGVNERWASIIIGTAFHATYWVSEWPRSAAHPGFLQPLLLGDTGTRVLSVIAEPLPTARALREIRKAKVEHAADAAQRQRIGQIEDEATRAEVADLQRREAELVAGHGDLRFTGLVTVSAGSETQLQDRCVALETAAAQAMCEVRRLVGQQGVAFLAGALPLARGVL